MLCKLKVKHRSIPERSTCFIWESRDGSASKKSHNGYGVVDTAISFSKQELIKEIKSYPERFSPNALFRPIYQEVVLPNLVTVGGGSELAYWLQLSAVFASFDLPMPMLKLRSSVLLIDDKQQQKIDKLDISISDLFLPTNELINHRVRQISNIDIDLGEFKAHLDQQFECTLRACKTNRCFIFGSSRSTGKKAKKGN